MELTIPTEISFECPEGTHSATFYHIKEITKGKETLVRLLFEANKCSTENTTVLVARNFSPSLRKGSQLRDFLDCWLGAEFVEENRKGNKFNFESIQNMKADVVVQSISNPEYPKPFIRLEAAYPPGSLVATCCEEQGDI